MIVKLIFVAGILLNISMIATQVKHRYADQSVAKSIIVQVRRIVSILCLTALFFMM